jgi:hypothetical protein
MSVRADLHIDAVVCGLPVAATWQSSGNGEWFTGTGGLEVEDWIWCIEPAAASPDRPSVPLLIRAGSPRPPSVTATPLRIQDPGRPSWANFVRI